MFSKKTDITAQNLDKEIENLLATMETMDRLRDAEYPKMVELLAKLYALRNDNTPKRMSPDAKATIAANLAGIILILGHERAHIVTSKALSFVQKLR
jgi:uncharacterized membrane protein YkvA (DUF1232 family)